MEKKKKIPCVLFHKQVKHNDLVWPAKSIGVIPFYKDDLSLARLVLDKVIELQPIDYYFPDYKEGDGARRLFTHIGNGIGDIFAFSSMAWYLRGYPLQVHVTKRFHPVIFEHWPPVTFRRCFQPDPFVVRFVPVASMIFDSGILNRQTMQSLVLCQAVSKVIFQSDRFVVIN